MVLDAVTINYSRSSSRGCENGGKVARMRRRRGKGRLDFQDGPVQRMVEKGENPGFCTGGLENAPLKRQNSVNNSFTFLAKVNKELLSKIARTCDFYWNFFGSFFVKKEQEVTGSCPARP